VLTIFCPVPNCDILHHARWMSRLLTSMEVFSVLFSLDTQLSLAVVCAIVCEIDINKLGMWAFGSLKFFIRASAA